MTSDQLFVLAILAVFVTPGMAILTTIITRKLDRIERLEAAEMDRRDRREVAEAARVASSEAKSAAEAAQQSAKELSADTAKQVTLKEGHVELLEAVTKGTEASHAAEKVANHANLKIEQMQKVITRALHLPDEAMTDLSLPPEQDEQDKES